MPRNISATIRAVIAQDYLETHDIVDITLPASGLESAITIYCGGKSGLVVDSNLYLPTLRSISQIKFSLGTNPDSADISLENLSQTFGAVLTDPERTLDGASVIIKRAFLISGESTYESMILFSGKVQNIKVDQNVVSLSLVSDMSHKAARLAYVQVSQRCRHIFNVNGSGVGPDCGWRSGGTGNPVDQVGNPTDCDLILDSPNGCLGHANQHRFGGVPTLIPNHVEPVGESNGGYDAFEPPLGGNLDADYRSGGGTPIRSGAPRLVSEGPMRTA